MLVPQLLEAREAALVQLPSLVVEACDVGRAAVGAQGVRLELGSQRILRRRGEERCEPASALPRVMDDPELLERRRQLEPERRRAAGQRPVERRAQVVLLGDDEVEPLAARAEIACVEVALVGEAKKELGVPLPDGRCLVRRLQRFG